MFRTRPLSFLYNVKYRLVPCGKRSNTNEIILFHIESVVYVFHIFK